MNTQTPTPVAVFDIDGTIVRSSLVIELTHALIAHDIFPAEVADKFTEEEQRWRNREGEYREYINALVDVYDQYVTGKNSADIESIAQDVARDQSLQTYRYTRELVASLRKTHHLIAISGSPVEVVAPFATAHGFHHAHGTYKHRHDNGDYLSGAEIGSHNKHETLQEYIDTHQLTLTGSVGVGDTESDISFLECVEQPIVFNPNQQLFKAASERGWKIVIERKDMIYELNHDFSRHNYCLDM